MKTFKLSFSVLLLSLTVLFTHCSKDRNENISTSQQEFIEPIFSLDDVDEMENPDVEEANELQEFRLRDSSKHNQLKPCERPFKNHTKECKKGERRDHKTPEKGLPFILKELELDSAQKHAIRSFLKDHCDCLADNHKKVHQINREEILKANIKRREVLADFKAGKITKDQLKNNLLELHKILKENLRQDNDKKEHIAMIRKCREQLMRNISSVLNEDQNNKFHAWLKNKK